MHQHASAGVETIRSKTLLTFLKFAGLDTADELRLLDQRSLLIENYQVVGKDSEK